MLLQRAAVRLATAVAMLSSVALEAAEIAPVTAFDLEPCPNCFPAEPMSSAQVADNAPCQDAPDSVDAIIVNPDIIVPIEREPPTPPQQLQGVTVPTLEAFEIAQESGFTFRAVNNGADANDTCRIGTVFGFESEAGANLVLEARNVPVSFPGIEPPVECDFSLFAGRALADGWSVIELKAVPLCHVVTAGIRRQSVSGSQIDVRMEVTGILEPSGLLGNKCWLVMVAAIEMKLQGPAGADWREAFR